LKVAVFGTGGVGGYFGGRLAQAGAQVHLIARGAHLESLRDKGLRVRSVRGDFDLSLPATDDPVDIGPCDFVLFTVKAFHTRPAASQLSPLIGPSTAVVSLQNGVDNEATIAGAVGSSHVMGGIAYIFSEILEPGVVAHTGGPASLVFGEMDGTRSERAKQLLDQCAKAEISAQLSEDIRAGLWSKFAFICAVAGTTAAIRLPLGDIRSTPDSWEMFRRIVEEVCAVAAAEGVDLPPDTVARHVAFAESLEPHGYSSLHFDMTHGRPMEVEALHGTVVRLGRKHGVPVPMAEAVHAVLKPWAVRNKTPD
jgi:2-dehydropantoate 2-reductase